METSSGYCLNHNKDKDKDNTHMNNTSTMFLSNLTIVDHAYIDQRGNVVGGSFNPSFIVSGELDPVEQVVVDFSAVKKQIKQIIDDRAFGFDHKLWFIEGFSAGVWYEDDEYINITTPTTQLDVPKNAIKVIEDGIYTTDSIGRHFGNLVERELSKLHPGVNIKVECINSTDAHFPSPTKSTSFFTYAHGLKESTSWGCKNIAHGHLSFIQILAPIDTPKVADLEQQIANDINDTLFVFKENVVNDNEHFLTISYDTCERGKFSMTVDKDAYNITVLDTETTVEHLVDFIAGEYVGELVAVGATALLVSEGLSKGAVARIVP